MKQSILQIQYFLLHTKTLKDAIIVVVDKVWDREPQGSKLIAKTCKL
jgi:hypothetical protein